MINEDVKVSIIVPSYKRKREFYARAIESLRNQTYRNIEIVVIDDNAKEELLEYREELSAYIREIEDDRILYVANKENLGSVGSRNAGIDSASGEYITFLDDDDRYLPTKIENQLKYTLDNGLDMSFTNQVLVDDNERVVDFREYRRIKDFENSKLLQYHLSKKITGTNTFMAKKSLLEKIGGFNGADMGDEFYLMYDIISSGCKIGYCDDSGVVATRGSQVGLTLGENRLRAEKKLFEFIKSNYDKMTFGQRCYARFRYNVTKLMTYKRAKRYFKMLCAMVMAFLSSPVSFFIEPLRMRDNIKEVRALQKQLSK
ncbi:MAG: glycosyltransferase family 2 protein [Clostridia bacterium]|jgi:glycosyltransferase involved in cell wall biosynthesis|nr:glycosyltransferase family 2 protein [Clostridia bacterium]MCX4367541.1 glycosyltransferase family 2 protein [Clostridia bacterium]